MNKNNFTLLLYSLLLCSCGGNNSSLINSSIDSSSSINESSIHTISSSIESSSINEKLNINNVLDNFKKGIKLSVIGTESYNNITNNLYLQTTSKNKEFSFMQFQDENFQNKRIHEYYTSLENDNTVYATRLDVSNQYNYYPVYNPITTGAYTWDEGYNNPFLNLSIEDFENINDSYNLKSTSINKTNSITTLFYGNPGLKLNSLLISISDDNNITLECEAFFEGSTTYEYFFSGTVLELGETTSMDYRIKPFEEKSDLNFIKMLNALKNQNYTATITNYYNDKLESTSRLYSNMDKLYYETGSYKAGFYLLDDGKVQEITKEGNNFYKVGLPMNGSLEEFRPQFRMNRACFDKTDNKYKMKDTVEGSIGVVTLFEANAEELDNFTITINDNSYVFINISGKNKTMVIFTNIGNTNVGYTKDTVLEK